MSPKKYFAKNLELGEPRNLLFSNAGSAMKLQFGGFLSSFGALDVALNYKFLGTQNTKFLAKYYFGLNIVKSIKSIPVRT